MSIVINILMQNIEENLKGRVCKRAGEDENHRMDCINYNFMSLDAYCDLCLFKLYLEEEKIMHNRIYSEIRDSINEIRPNHGEDQV